MDTTQIDELVSRVLMKKNTYRFCMYWMDCKQHRGIKIHLWSTPFQQNLKNKISKNANYAMWHDVEDMEIPWIQRIS